MVANRLRTVEPTSLPTLHDDFSEAIPEYVVTVEANFARHAKHGVGVDSGTLGYRAH